MKIKILFLSCLSLFMAFYCSRPDTIKIGFMGTLTGRQSDVGVSARNGVIFGVERINAKGGINGKKINLIIKDDQGNSDVAKKIVNELIDEKVVAIIGPVLSGMTQAVLPAANENKMLLLSPTSVSNVFNQSDDFLIRVSPATNKAVFAFADYAFNKIKLKKLTIVYDLSNKSYTEDWYNNFKLGFEREKGKIIKAVPFLGRQKNNFTELAKKLLKTSPDGLVIIAGALDSALLCQQIRKIDSKIPLLIAGWAMTDDLIANGGKAVEGVHISYNFDKNSQQKEYVEFKNEFDERFGTQPDFSAKFSYEAVNVLEIALSHLKNLSPENIKGEIIRQKQFKGLQGVLNIDSFGDADSVIFFFTVKNGAFYKID